MATGRACGRNEIPGLVIHWGQAVARAHRAAIDVLEIPAARADRNFVRVPRATGWWLGKRAKPVFERGPFT